MYSKSRFIGFLACCAGGIACFGIAFLFLPIRMLSQLQREYFVVINMFVDNQQLPLNHGSLRSPLPLAAVCLCLDSPSYMVLGTVCCFLARQPNSDTFVHRFQAYSFSRTTSLLTLLFWLFRPHPFLRHRYQIHHRYTPGLNHTGRCPAAIRGSLFPRRYDYFETRRSNGYERRGEPITNLIT